MADKKIYSKLIFLKRLSPKDKRQIKKWDKDPEVSKYREIYRRKDKKLESINFGVYDSKSSELIGNIGISSIDLRNKHAEIGMAIGDTSHWGRGYGKDLVETILRYCFIELELNKVYLDVWEENERAIGCYLKCGFKKDGLFREHVLKRGKYNSKWLMSILRKEWKR